MLLCGSGVCQHQLTNGEVGLRHVTAQSHALADLGAVWPRHTTISKRLDRAAHALGSLVVIDGLVAAGVEAHGIWVLLLNLVGHETDMGLLVLITLVLEGVDRQAVVRLANLLDVVLEAAV